MNKYLHFLQEADRGYAPKKGDTMLCEVCGRKVHVLNNGRGPLICCMQAMVKIKVGG